jgi:hypothetical protein
MSTQSENQALTGGPVGQETESAPLGPLDKELDGSVTIDFDALIDSGQLPIGTVITNQFAGEGVIFSLQRIDNPSYPGPIADGFGPPNRGMFNTFNYYIPIIADFTVPVRKVSFGSILDSPLTVKAYDAPGTLLDTVSIGGYPEIGEITTTTDIAKLVFFNDSGTGYNGRSDLTIVKLLTFGGKKTWPTA